jgi:hypothetical protein
MKLSEVSGNLIAMSWQTYAADGQALCHPTSLSSYRDGYKSFPSGHVSCKYLNSEISESEGFQW